MTDTADIETLRHLPLSYSQRDALLFWWKSNNGFQVPDITVEDNVMDEDVKALMGHGLIKAYHERGHNFVDLTDIGWTLAHDIANPKPPKINGHRVWIELDLPDSDLPIAERNAVAEERAKLATSMIAKLGGSGEFWWNEKKKRYNFSFSAAGGYNELNDNGEWFKLDFLAAPAEPSKERAEAERQVTQSLFGLEDSETVSELLETMGPSALTDDAMIKLKDLQISKDNRSTR